ncbi:hypothetical protein Leryth_007174 [Lithospermum erythrorhizon]|nr:hypothetical protein Leryth_007174 [Lithospermum erythrorhizon]
MAASSWGSSTICPLLSTSYACISTRNVSCCNVYRFQPHQYGVNVDEDEEEVVLGDCLVFEEGIFDDPYIQQTLNPTHQTTKKSKANQVETDNLIPDNWLQAQKEINITKKERRKLALELEFGRKVDKRRFQMRPIESANDSKNVAMEDFVKYREEKLKQLKPIVLDSPVFTKGKVTDEEDRETESELGEEKRSESSSRVSPRNPKWAVYGGGLDDITEFFNSGTYDPNAAKKPQGPRKLLSKEEKQLLNRRIPDLAVATSVKWLPFHTLAASGEFYLATSLLKHNVDINVRDKNGLSAIHKAILGKKQAICNLLLRESANPFIRDKEGATLMHYAVRTASCQMIKILLLYNVDINQQDDDGWTPLHLAVQSCRTDVVRLLLIKGADKTLRNQDGLMPLDLCLHSGHNTRTYEIIRLLKQPPKTRVY